MSEQIYEPDENFKFENLILTSPTVISGGNYFIKFLMDKCPLYIQVPKCVTKQGLIKAGKKIYCDLMFTNENESFIRWMEDLENYCQDYIFKNREQWFETDLEKHDIENSFTSPLKIFKSGKFYISRTNVPTRLGKCILKIFDENENNVNIDDIKESTNVITILEIQGIKCSARNFQIEIEIKQMMVLKPCKLFERCVIKGTSKSTADLYDDVIKNDTNNLGNNDQENIPENISENIPENISENIQENIQENIPENIQENIPENIQEEPPKESLEYVEPPSKVIKTYNPDILEEIDFNLDNLGTDSVNLKKPNDVYYDMYREARRKAKMARNVALSAYLEAKKIKNMYMLDEINDNDDLSESDLEDDSFNFENENEK